MESREAFGGDDMLKCRFVLSGGDSLKGVQNLSPG